MSILKEDLGSDPLKKKAAAAIGRRWYFKTKHEEIIWSLKCFSDFLVLNLHVKQMDSESDHSFFHPSWTICLPGFMGSSGKDRKLR